MFAIAAFFWRRKDGAVYAQSSRPNATSSFDVRGHGVSVRAAPDAHAARRGTVRFGARLPIFGAVTGYGCPAERWVQVGPEAYVCASFGEVVSLAPFAEPAIVMPENALLPRRYGFVVSDGVWAYSRPSRYFEDDYVASLGRGFGVAIVEEQELHGVRFVRSLAGLWIPAVEVRPARGSEFAGQVITAGQTIAFAKARGATLHRLERGRPRAESAVGARSTVQVTNSLGSSIAPRGYLWYREDDAESQTGTHLIRAAEWAIATVRARPEHVAPADKWIDIDLTQQVLVAYEGDAPVFATLVSTGRNGPQHRTPEGLFRIWAKLAEDTMDDLQNLDQPSNYAIEAVPWVQYFHEGIALHAAFWHDDFGRPRSHGCVNLSPRDARWLFAWTGPALPDGWDAIVPTATLPGTWVHVHR